MLKSLRRLLLLAIAVAAAGVLPNAPAEAASYRVVFDRKRMPKRDIKRMSRYIRRGCYIFQLSGAQKKFFRKAYSHAFKALNNGAVQRLIKRQRFTFTKHSGATVVRRYARKQVTVWLRGYANRRPTCKVGRHANAFHIYNTIYLKRSYLMKLMKRRDHKSLAKTLAHELMHELGYGHGKNKGQRSRAKKRSVPIYVGCLVKHFPNVKRARRVCGR